MRQETVNIAPSQRSDSDDDRERERERYDLLLQCNSPEGGQVRLIAEYWVTGGVWPLWNRLLKLLRAGRAVNLLSM